MAKYGLNKVTLIGNLGADPELKYLDQGIAYTQLRLACTDRYRGKDGNYQNRTEWVNVTLWRGNAEVVGKYCRKGSTLCIEGRLRNHSWETPEGERRSRMEVEGSQVILLDSPSEHPPVRPIAQPTTTLQSPPPSQPDQPVAPSQEGGEDDLPF
ncbi:MAG: single-stranded DNA-binding protein [Bacteroidetes bacterium]|nr:MAG: single-stranded DNA-binding protein [Bacteroidota bacterium]